MFCKKRFCCVEIKLHILEFHQWERTLMSDTKYRKIILLRTWAIPFYLYNVFHMILIIRWYFVITQSLHSTLPFPTKQFLVVNLQTPYSKKFVGIKLSCQLSYWKQKKTGLIMDAFYDFILNVETIDDCNIL